ncbi:uncharacterized protein LOC142222480 [Haematobia irritans]|uniref:uncharacterized protein LOC142222480 n=1 Tax=Haematobia irritans TaxID=7368 RepID=UPI003F4F9B39
MPLTDNELDADETFNISENNFERIQNKASKIGYADGVTDGRDSVFQTGFDLGYKDGLRTSFEIEKYRHFFGNINTEKLNDVCSDIMSEKETYEELPENRVKYSHHFQYLNHKDEPLTKVSQIQHEYVNDLMERYELKMPNASALLRAHCSTN